MGVLLWSLMGFMVGVVDRFVAPGRDTGRLIVTILLACTFGQKRISDSELGQALGEIVNFLWQPATGGKS